MDPTGQYRASNGNWKTPPGRKWIQRRHWRQNVQSRKILFQKKGSISIGIGIVCPRPPNTIIGRRHRHIIHSKDGDGDGDGTSPLHNNVKGMHQSNGQAHSRRISINDDRIQTFVLLRWLLSNPNDIGPNDERNRTHHWKIWKNARHNDQHNSGRTDRSNHGQNQENV